MSTNQAPKDLANALDLEAAALCVTKGRVDQSSDVRLLREAAKMIRALAASGPGEAADFPLAHARVPNTDGDGYWNAYTADQVSAYARKSVAASKSTDGVAFAQMYVSDTAVQLCPVQQGELSRERIRELLGNGTHNLYAHPPTAATPVGIVGERGDVSWRSEQILPVGTKLYAASTQPEQVREVDFYCIEGEEIQGESITDVVVDALDSETAKVGDTITVQGWKIAETLSIEIVDGDGEYRIAALREPRA